MSMTLDCEGTVTYGKSSRAAQRGGRGLRRPSADALSRCRRGRALVTRPPAAHMMACAALLR